MRGKSNIGKGVAPCHIGVDLLGSDIPPNELFEAVLSYSKELKPSVHLTLFGTSSLFGKMRPPGSNILLHVVKDVITMDDAPLTAIRRKRDSSLCTGIRMLKEGHLQAFISAGNTGALMACAKIDLPDLPHVERPALMTLLPTRLNEIAVLDVGANTSYKASQLVQFAAMGVAYQKSRGIKVPRVGLLNIGSEAKKGTPELQLAYNQLLTASQKKAPSFTFSGNIEGRDVFHGKIDVLVTDGFTGNVFLKTAEGIAAVILEELQNSPIEECSPHMKGILGEMRQRLHYAEYPGAILCGIDGIVIKCHGNSSPQSLVRSIATASRLVQHSFLDQVKKELKK
ncbi:MAG: phosphate acyltransferase PlsX [Verrucomicrobia bacterium]|nr:phosphate acyltransferase PlsX [Verrucomicrobiota bacterium]